MKIKSIISGMLCVAFSTCLAVAFSPSAYAVNTSDAPLAVANPQVSRISVQTAKTAPKPRMVKSMSAVFSNGQRAVTRPEGTANPCKYVKLYWEAPEQVTGLESQSYTGRFIKTNDRYTWKTKSMRKTKTIIDTPASFDYYVQIRTNAKSGTETVHSKWATFYLSTWRAHTRYIANGSLRQEYTDRVEIKNHDTDGPGTWEAEQLKRIPRSVKLTAAEKPSSGAVKVSWKEPKERLYWVTDYAVRYAYNKKMKGTKIKSGLSQRSVTLTGLKKNRRVYIQVCMWNQDWNSIAGTWYDTASPKSRWSDVKSIKVPSAAKMPGAVEAPNVAETVGSPESPDSIETPLE